ncbi:enoyl-CoA hydratase/isomerase family protein [Asanoa sp. NPDC049573]|uniref:enoyl-CoA hydratase/isomerase family protein n=1 Tax=Asanoa sp. NPDC049573 TaxID=3155396 RepID=UPI00343BD290
MTTSGVDVSHAGPVATVTLRRPDVLNAQTTATWMALRDIGRELPGDVRVVIVRGEGRSFSAGLDISGGAGSGFLAEIGRLSPEDAAERVRGYQEGFTWLHRPDIVSVAAVQGHAIGAGFQLALACDLRVLADDARLTMAEVTLGLVPDLAGTKRLVELVGYARALEVCLTGRRIAADEALRVGLATVVVPRDDLDSAVSDLVAALLSAPRDAVVEMKSLLSGAASRSWEEQLRAEREAQVRRLRDLAGLGE